MGAGMILLLVAAALGAGLYGGFRLGRRPERDAKKRPGEWAEIRLISTTGGSYTVVRCSVCGWQYPMARKPFCPNCGSPMEVCRKKFSSEISRPAGHE